MTQRQALFIFNIYKRMASLLDSFDKTNLDLENTKVLGGPNKDLQTQYPATSTGTPTAQANPNSAKNFIPKFTPTNTYLNQVVGSSNILQLASSFNRTNLDLENPSILGGPSKAINDPTVYPVLNSGVPTTKQNPTDSAKSFEQQYTPSKTYLENFNYRNRVVKDSPLSGDSLDPQILNITNLDNSEPGVIPYKAEVNDPTEYPTLATGRTAIRAWVPTINGETSVSAQKFDPKYDSSKKYQENIEVDLGIAPNAKEPEGPKDPKPGNGVVKAIKGVSTAIKAVGSLFGDATS